MNLFLIELTYKASLDLIDKYLDKHRDFLQGYYETGHFLLSGRKHPRNGGLILARFSNKSEVMEAVKNDPFFSLGIANYKVIEFEPTRTIPAWEQAAMGDFIKEPAAL